MIEIKLDGSTNNRMWGLYADAGYSQSGYIGYRAYVAALLPEVKVLGTTANGLTLRFDNDSDFTAFTLRWQ